MPQKGSALQNVFEQLEELGKKTAKQTAQAVNQSFNPLTIANEMSTTKRADEQERAIEQLKKDKPNATPLDFQQLSEKYAKQDIDKLSAVRKQFQSVKQGEERAIEELKKEEEERKKKILIEEQEKQRQHHQAQQQGGDMPQGKQRKGMMSPKKKAQEKHQETKPATGKQ